MEKQAYSFVQALKHFKGYVGYSRVIAFVPHTTEDIMSQHDYLGIRGKWISRIQEYDLEIKPTSKIKGQGFAKMLTEENERALDVGKKKDTIISLEIHEDLQHHESP